MLLRGLGAKHLLPSLSHISLYQYTNIQDAVLVAAARLKRNLGEWRLLRAEQLDVLRVTGGVWSLFLGVVE